LRIAFINWSNRAVGGAEQYLASISAHLFAQGHTLALWHETDTPSDRQQVPLPDGTPVWNARQLGLARALDHLRAWKPDVTFFQGMLDPAVEEKVLAVAPSVFFAHNFYGLCISGGRTLTRPEIRGCTHQFGAKCLLRYYPERCGGLNPLTMITDYRTNTKRLRNLGAHSAVVSHSQFVISEYQRHGIACRRLRFFANDETGPRTLRRKSPNSPWRLLMMGRMMTNKGGQMLLDAMPSIAKGLDRPVSLLLAGDGPCRAKWEEQAESIRKSTGADITFSGWLTDSAREGALAEADLLLLPSLWPEPFGMIGVEAGHYGVPTVAFRVGGISDWLEDGVNGCFASGDKPSAPNLADAVIRCLSDESRFEAMRAAAVLVGQRLTIQNHYADLKSVFDDVTSEKDRRTA
jgi:glycosyltransferase involved in cell wall biosynthesis